MVNSIKFKQNGEKKGGVGENWTGAAPAAAGQAGAGGGGSAAGAAARNRVTGQLSHMGASSDSVVMDVHCSPHLSQLPPISVPALAAILPVSPFFFGKTRWEKVQRPPGLLVLF